jgi:hypothetical protein
MSASAAVSDKPLHPDERPLAEYRSVSRAAVAAAGLGLASSVVLVTPLLALVPIAAVGAAMVALRSIRSSGGQLVGRVPAVAGLCIAVMFLGWSVTQHFGRQLTLENNARRVVERWFLLLGEGKVQQAYQFRLHSSERILSPEAQSEYFEKNQEAARNLQGFASQAGIKELIAAGQRAGIRFDAVTSAHRDGFSDSLVLKYTLDRSFEQGGPLPMWVHVTRRVDERSKKSDWEIGSVDTTPPLAAQ